MDGTHVQTPPLIHLARCLSSYNCESPKTSLTPRHTLVGNLTEEKSRVIKMAILILILLANKMWYLYYNNYVDNR
jgi:hypothetical protein